MLFSYNSNFKFSKIRDIIFISLIHICVYCNDLDLKIQMVGVGIMEVNYVTDKKFISKIMKKIYSILPILSGICFGSLGIFVRDLSKNMNSTTIISSRIIFAAIILGIWIACFHAEYFKIKLKDIWICVCSGILGTLGLNICYNFAIFLQYHLLPMHLL